MSIPTIRIDLDKKCEQCGKGGACQNGICLRCIAKNMKLGKYDHILKRHRIKKGVIDSDLPKIPCAIDKILSQDMSQDKE